MGDSPTERLRPTQRGTVPIFADRRRAGVIPGWAVEELARRVTKGTSGTKGDGRLVKEYAERYSVSVKTVYRRLAACAGQKATLRITAEEKDAAMLVSGYLQACMSRKDVAPSTEEAIRELARMGKMPGTIPNSQLPISNERGKEEMTKGGRPPSRQRMDAVMGAMGLTKRHMHRPKACRRLTAAAPNDWHQVDWSPAGMFYLQSGWVGVTPNYKKDTTLKKGRTPIRIGMVVDMYSGCCYAKAYESAGESTELAVSTLYDAWRDKGDPGFPFHGVPWHLYSDQSGALKSGPSQALLDNLFCKWVGHTAHRPTATGLAERRIQACQKWETVIRGRQAFGYQFSLREFNSWLHEWCVDENNRKHWRNKSRTRFQMWSDIQDENIRRCPEWDDFVRLSAAMEDTRRVSQYQTIQWNGETMFLGDGAVEVIGERVHVYRMADGRQYAKHGGKVFGPLAEGAPVNVMGTDYKQPRLTESERNLKEARASAAGIGLKPRDMAHIRDEKSEAFGLREGRQIEGADGGGPVGRVGQVGQVGRPVRNYLEAKDWLVNRVGSLAGLDWEGMARLEGCLDDLLEKFGEITERELEEIAKAVEGERGEGGSGEGEMAKAKGKVEMAKCGADGARFLDSSDSLGMTEQQEG